MSTRTSQIQRKKKKLNFKKLDQIFEESQNKEKTNFRKGLNEINIPPELQRFYEEHKKIVPRPTVTIPLNGSKKLFSLIRKERRHAEKNEHKLSLWKIRKLRTDVARKPTNNTEIFIDKPIIIEP